MKPTENRKEFKMLEFIKRDRLNRLFESMGFILKQDDEGFDYYEKDYGNGVSAEFVVGCNNLAVTDIQLDPKENLNLTRKIGKKHTAAFLNTPHATASEIMDLDRWITKYAFNKVKLH